MTLQAKVCVVIVTFNRKELLLSLLKELLDQTQPISGYIIVDNSSTDGTPQFLMDNGVIGKSTEGIVEKSIWNTADVLYYRSKKNTGGAGGFARALSIASEQPYDYVWIMDDDVSPERDCLQKLLEQMSDDCKACIPTRQSDNWNDNVVTDYNLRNPFLLNLDQIKTFKRAQNVAGIYEYIVDMPMEGPLLKMELLREVGVPNADYFIIFDDTDYAHRICKLTKIKYVTNARLKRVLAKGNTKPKDWDWKDYYLLRNQFVFDRRYGENILVREFRPWLSKTAKICSALIKRKRDHIPVIRRAYRDARSGNMGETVKPGTDIKMIR